MIHENIKLVCEDHVTDMLQVRSVVSSMSILSELKDGAAHYDLLKTNQPSHHLLSMCTLGFLITDSFTDSSLL